MPAAWSQEGVVKVNCSSGVCCRSNHLTNFALLTNIAGARHVRWLMLACIYIHVHLTVTHIQYISVCAFVMCAGPQVCIATTPFPSPLLPSPLSPPSLLLYHSQSDQVELGLRVLSYIGCGLSIICLLITIVALSVFR